MIVDDPELRSTLETALAVPRWADEVAARAPFDGVDALLEAGRTAAIPLTADEIAGALARHPRIGERPVGEGAEAVHSRREQAASDAGDVELAAAIAAGNIAYEARFDRVFLIRAAGRTRREILEELTRRLELDDATELGIVAEQLREIALLRLQTTFEGAPR